MGRNNIVPDICFKCRAERAKVKRDVPCEVDNICGYTGIDIYDEVDGMDIHHKVWMIAQLWQDITRISRKEKYEKIGKNDSKTIYHFPTIEMVDIYLCNQNWTLLPFTKEEAFYLISLFHINYVSTIQ